MAFGLRQIKLAIVGDSSSAERALSNVEKRLRNFGHASDNIAKGGLIGGLFEGRGLAAFAGGGAVALGLEKILDAGKEAEVVLGQTRLTVDNLGLGWEKNASTIESATKDIAKTAGFYDEQVLQSFQMLVRGSKDVNVALDRTALAANVARGRYISLEAATMLVNKAALGQIGALRRAGIAIDKNATAAEALALLERNFSGAAEQYGKTAAGAQDKARVAIEQSAEALGQKLTPAVVASSDALVTAIDRANGFGKALKNLSDSIPVIKVPIQFVFGGGRGSKALGLTALFGISPAAFYATVGKAAKDALFGSGSGTPAPTQGAANAPDNQPGLRGPGAFASSSSTKNNPRLSQEQRLLIARDKARNNAYLSDDLKTARLLVDFYKKQKDKAKSRKALNEAERNLVAAQGDLYNTQKEIADNATAASEKAAQALKERAKKAEQAQKKMVAALKKQASDFKSKVLDILDAKSTNLQTLHDLQDAQRKLKLAERLGGPATIKEARYELAQARIARQRALLEQDTVKASKSGVYTFTGPITINGVTNVKQLIAELDRLAKRTTTQSRGRAPAGRPGRA